MSVFVAAALPGCGESGGAEQGSEDDETGLSGTEDSGPEVFDVGAGEESAGTSEGGEQACVKVDVVIAVDNSSSMSEEIEALSGPVFDSFPQSLLAVGNGLEDFHLAVIDACNMPAAFHDWGGGGACGFSTGANYMVSTSPALALEYSCVMDLSKSGYQNMPDACSGSDDDEQPVNTAADAVSEPAASSFNAGFLRNDAVLFVVAITDEDEKPIPTATAAEIAQKIIDAKGTIQNVVFLGIAGGDFPGCLGTYGTAIEGATVKEVAAEFAAAGRGMFWDICDGSLEEAFQAGIELVDSACNEYVPEG